MQLYSGHAVHFKGPAVVCATVIAIVIPPDAFTIIGTLGWAFSGDVHVSWFSVSQLQAMSLGKNGCCAGGVMPKAIVDSTRNALKIKPEALKWVRRKQLVRIFRLGRILTGDSWFPVISPGPGPVPQGAAAGPGHGGTRPLCHVKKLNMMNLTRPAVLNLAAKNLL
jgi:hypothetical protein